ncbi:MAG: hemolysin family protein [Thermoanaerobaculia bacterium]
MGFGFELLVILSLTLINGFFSAAEIGILSVRRTRLLELANEGKRGASAALRLRKNPERFLATVQVGITVLGASAGAFGGATLEAPLAAALSSLGVRHLADELALAVVVAFVSVLSIVLGELVPKSLALRSSERVSLLVARPLLGISRAARPVVWFLTTLSNLLLRPFRDRTTFTESRLSPDELQHLVEEASTAGSLLPAAGNIASRAIDLGGLPISSLLIPRPQVAYLRRDATREEIWALLKSRPHSRYPVVAHDLDAVEGYVTERELVRQLVEEKSVDLASVLRQVPMVAARTGAVAVLRDLQERRLQLAVVIDQHGMTAGIVTIDDIAEELLGEILSENEKPEEAMLRDADGFALVRADTPVQEVNRKLGTELSVSSDYSTLSGLLMHESGKILRAGEELLVDGVRFEVIEATPRQVKVVRVHLPSGSPRKADAS